MEKSKQSDVTHENRVKVIKANAKMQPSARALFGIDVQSDMEYIKKHNLKINYKR